MSTHNIKHYVYAIDFTNLKLLSVFVSGLNILFDKENAKPWSVGSTLNGGNFIQHKSRTVDLDEFYARNERGTATQPIICIQDKYLSLFLEYTSRLISMKESGERKFREAKERMEKMKQRSSGQFATTNPKTLDAMKKRFLVQLPAKIPLTLKQLNMQQTPASHDEAVDMTLIGPEEYTMVSNILFQHMMRFNASKVEIMNRLVFVKQQLDTVVAKKKYIQGQVQKCKQALEENAAQKEAWVANMLKN